MTYTPRIFFIDRSAGSGADIIAKGWKENHWARPTIKDSYFPSEETEPCYPRENNGRKT